MAFIRTKKIKGAEYAYIVENKWKRKKAKQKSKKYLGRVYRPDRANVMDFYEYHDIENVGEYLKERSKQEILLDLIRLELFNHGFERERGVWANGDCYFDEKSMKVENSKGNPIALAFNDGFLTTYAIRNIMKFRAFDEEEGYDFAKMIVEAGLAIPSEVFVGVFRKIMR